MKRIKFWTKIGGRYVVWMIIITMNRLLQKSSVPKPWVRVFVEPTSNCNLACRFCSYPLEVRARETMSEDLFDRCMQGIQDLGVEQLWITPMTGDVFMDKDIETKLARAQGSSAKSISFYTNFVVPDEAVIKALKPIGKLREIHISLYGADEDAFVAMTRKPAKLFQRLVRNLEILNEELNDWSNHPMIYLELREGQQFRLETWRSPLAVAVDRLVRAGLASLGVQHEYDTWGGQITPEHVEGLDISLVPGEALYQRGACFHVFRSPMVTSSGVVIACGCRGHDADLVLGELTETPLKEILSFENPRLQSVVSNMNAGKFPRTCRSCSMYRSVWDHRWSRGMDPHELTTLEDVLRPLKPDHTTSTAPAE